MEIGTDMFPSAKGTMSAYGRKHGAMGVGAIVVAGSIIEYPWPISTESNMGIIISLATAPLAV